jgi:hypothetical protein
VAAKDASSAGFAALHLIEKKQGNPKRLALF